jgi:tetratricopeptide (TPR) repeat protein
MDPSAPRKINKYDVIDLIGRGGMGVVYKAIDRSLDRLVAIKMVTSGADPRGDLLKRFYRESQFTANLRHQNIVTVYELGDFEGRPYLVMEYLAGQSLDLVLARQQLTLQQRINYVRQVCQGLHYAHSRQPSIIHRDIKPANIVILEDGTAKIVDFGIARLGQSNDTHSGQLMGSYHYMSPEQIESAELDGRSDIFSAGVVLYQLLTRVLPFEGNGIAQTLHRIVNSPPPPLAQSLKEYPAALDEIIPRALAKNRDDRYQSAAEFSFDLMQVEGGLLRGSSTGYIERAENLLREGDFEGAKQELIHVLDVDHQNTRANDLMREVQQAIMRQQRKRRARDLRSHAQEALDRNRLGEALGFLEQAIGLDHTDTGLQAFREHVRELQARAATLNEILERAERLCSAHDLDGATRAIAEALEFDPHSARVKAFKLIIEAKILERERKRQVQELLASARQRIGCGEFEAALEFLKKAGDLDPTVSGLRDLTAVAEAGRRGGERHKFLQTATAEIKEALNCQNPMLARDLTAVALDKFPGERSLLDLKAAVEQQIEVHTRDKAAIHLVSDSSDRETPSPPASARSNSVSNVWTNQPGAAALRKPRPQDQAVAELTPIQGIDYLGVQPKPQTDEVHADLPPTATLLGIPDTILSPSETGYPMSPGSPPVENDRKLDAQRSPTKAWPPELLLAAEKRLVSLIGPLARVVVKRAVSQAKDLDELYMLVAQKIERPKDREAFLASMSQAARASGLPAGVRQQSSQVESTDLGGSRAELTTEAIEDARRLLAHYVGPLAGVLTKRAAQQATGLAAFYGLLARHIETEAERARFLQEAGFRSR